MNRVKHIEIDLDTFKIVLQFQNYKAPLILHFDTPSRKFYLSLIVLIVNEMKQPSHSGYVYIRKHEQLLKFLDDKLAGSYASGTIDGMWEKIRKAWQYSLPKLEEAAHFKIEGRDVKPPYEKGGKFLYECTEKECDIWANLFGIDDITNKWRFRFAFDTIGISSDDVTLKFGKLRDGSAWKEFLKDLDTPLSEISPNTRSKSTSIVKTHKSHWQLYAVAAIAVILLLVGGATILNRYIRPAAKPVDAVITNRPSIAVLPFVNVSDDPDKDYFCDGITEELINSLARVKDLRVISRTSAFYFKDKGFDLRTIGQKLNVEYILEGSVRVSGNKLKISAQLINVADDSHLWANTYDREMNDIFNTQEELAQKIACNLKSRLGCKENVLSGKQYTANFEAYDLYLKGHFFLLGRRTKTDFEKAIHYYEEALKIDPNFALAYAGLADVYNEQAMNLGIPPHVSYQKAKFFAEKALRIDDSLSEAHAAMGLVKIRHEWDWSGAKRSIQRAIDLNPNNIIALRNLCSYYRAVGRLEDAILTAESVLQKDPLNREINWHLGILFRINHQVDEAIAQFKKVLELDPDNQFVSLFLGITYIQKGLFEEGIELLEHIWESKRYAEHPFMLMLLCCSYSQAGDKERAYNILDIALTKWRKGYFSPYSLGMMYSCLNEVDKAFGWLEIAYEKHDIIMYPIKTIPEFSVLHDDPRWLSLLRRMGLEG